MYNMKSSLDLIVQYSQTRLQVEEGKVDWLTEHLMANTQPDTRAALTHTFTYSCHSHQ